MGERLSINKEKALRRRYVLRKTGNGRSFETTIPREVVEREARGKGLEIDEFLEEYVAEVLYGDFHGVHITFTKGEKAG